MPSVGFEPTIPANERPKTYALDSAATGTGPYALYVEEIKMSYTIIILLVWTYVSRCPYLEVPGISDGFIEVLEVKMKNLRSFTEISPGWVKCEFARNIWYDTLYMYCNWVFTRWQWSVNWHKIMRQTVIYKRRKNIQNNTKNTGYTKQNTYIHNKKRNIKNNIKKHKSSN